MGDVYFELLAEDFKQRGLSDWATASKLISKNKEYASQGDPSVTSKIKYLKQNSYRGQLRADAYESIRAGASTQDAYNISQGISTTTMTAIPQQTQGSTSSNISVNIIPRQNSGLTIGSTGTGGNIEVLKAGEYSSSGRGYYAPMGSKPTDWARAIDTGASLSSGLSQVGGFKTSPIKAFGTEPQGVYEFNVGQLGKAQYIDYTVSRFQANPTSFRGMKGFSETNNQFVFSNDYQNTINKGSGSFTGAVKINDTSMQDYLFNYDRGQITNYKPLGNPQRIGNIKPMISFGDNITTYSLSSDYFNANMPSNKAYTTYAREQFNRLPESIKFRSRVSELGFGTAKVATEFKVGYRDLLTEGFSNQIRYDSQGKRIKNTLALSSFESSILSTPQATNLPVTPYGLAKGASIWNIGIGTVGGVSGNIKSLGYSRGIKESIIQLSPVRPVNNVFIPNVQNELLSTGYKTTEFKFSGGRTSLRTTGKSSQLLPTSDLFNAPRNFKIKVVSTQYTQPINNQLKGNVRTTSSIPYVKYAGGEFSFGKFTSTQNLPVEFYPSKFIGGTTAEISQGNTFKTVETFRSNTPTKIKGIVDFRYVSGQEVSGFKPSYSTKTFNYDGGVNIDVRGRGTSFDFSRMFQATSTGKGFKMVSGGGTKTSLASTYQTTSPLITVQTPVLRTPTATTSISAGASLFKGTTSTKTNYAPLSFTALSIKPITEQKQKSEQGLIPRTRTIQGGSSTSLLTVPTVTTATSFNERVTPIFIQPQPQTQYTPSRQITKTVTSAFPIGTGFTSTSYFKPVGSGIDIPKFAYGSFGSLGLGSRQLLGGKRVTGYAPSFSALVFKIKGRARKDKTGLGFRPIPSGFSFTKRLKINGL